MAAKKRTDKKRANGGGSVYQRKDGKWIAALSLPTGPGKSPRRKVKVGRNEAHAKRLLGEMRRELEKSGDLMTKVPTLKEWVDYWLKNVCSDLKPSAYDDYEGVMRRYAIPFMGNKKIDKITPTMVLDLYAWMQADKTEDGLGLSPTTALGMHRKLRKCLKDAMRLAGLPRNPVDLVDAPKAAAVKQPTLTSEQALHFLVTHSDKPYVARYATGFFTGARQGEVLGLQVPFVDIHRDSEGNPYDVDIEYAWAIDRLVYQHGCLDQKGNVTCGWKRGAECPQQFFRIPKNHEAIPVYGALHLLRPKTQGSWRVTSGGPMLARILDRVIGDREDGFVFTTTEGNPIDPRVDWQIWQDWLQEAGLPQMGTHAQRHSSSTLLAITGADEKTRMDMLGHTTTQINRRYTHDDMTLQRAAAKRLAGVLTFDYKGEGAATIAPPRRRKIEMSVEQVEP